MSETASSDRPYLLVDVDGVLNPFGPGARRNGFERHSLLGFDVWLSRRHGEWLNLLADQFVLVWATTWQHEAQRLVAPRIGLSGTLSVIEFTSTPMAGETWKLPDVEAFVGDHAFAWIDDDIGRDAIVWGHQREAPTLLLRTRPSVGLTEEHIDRLEAFARRVAIEHPGR